MSMHTPIASAWIGFLSPEETVPWLPPDALMQYIAQRLMSADDEPAFVGANRLALEALRSGLPDLAISICRVTSGYAWRKWGRSNDSYLICLGMQPLVNLMRIDGYVGDLAVALMNLSELEKVADGQGGDLYGKPVPTEVFRHPTHRGEMISAFARTVCLQETAKILWRRRQYSEMQNTTARLIKKWPRFATHGTYHTVEAQWLLQADAKASLKQPDGWPLMLHRICMQHHVAQSADVEMAFTLFATRPTEAAPRAANAAARDIAFLGDSLSRAGYYLAGRTCFEESHDIARRVDPGLANLIRDRWATYAGQPALPPNETCARPSRASLYHAWALTTQRFQPE